MGIAFERFKEIDKLNSVIDKQREWLKDYDKLVYSIAEEGKHKIKWATESKRYHDEAFDPQINCIKEKKNRLKIEFDDHDENKEKDKKKIKGNIKKVINILQEKQWGYIRSSHQGASDYLWIEFTRDLNTKEKEGFLKWIAPEDSEIDMNFASPKRVFPVLFAVHWKHSYQRELPVEFIEGEQVDFDSLNIPITSAGRIINTIQSDGFNYHTFQKTSKVFSLEGQAEHFNQIQPLFYDKSGNFWLWDMDLKFWEIVDDTDVLNMISNATGEDVVSSKNRTEIINALKQEGRKKIPEDIKPRWIQFKDKIFDIETGEQFEATPKYFVTNPIPYTLHPDKFEQTPIMDKIFEEWVGKEYVKTLYEIISYCLLPDYPIHRLFCLIGSGMNGKSCFLNLLRKFVGINNVTSTELDTLLNSRFEVTRLHKKLVCVMGETNFNQLSKTSLLKKLTGGDLIGFEYKNKNPFEDNNYAKIIIATNNLPTTDDKTLGFYRRWTIIDFPNQFSEKKDILKDIPEEEYNCLALKCAGLLKDLLKERKFYNEGTVEERTEKYESKSNFLDKFLENFTEERVNGYISKADFYKRFVSWCKENRHREMSETSLGMAMKKKGIESERKYAEWLYDGKGGQMRVWIDLTWKDFNL